MTRSVRDYICATGYKLLKQMIESSVSLRICRYTHAASDEACGQFRERSLDAFERQGDMLPEVRYYDGVISRITIPTSCLVQFLYRPI